MGSRAQVAAARARGRPRMVLRPPLSLCTLAWIVFLVPGTLDVIGAAAIALVAVVCWARELLMALPEHARTRSF
ncbi:hypothetical protein EDB83DRAFT_2436216 [Lactarius deliciosus]|nr:hypothetical protein EDB83DRAFT_2436216 [Lactarius deliciosus]